MPFHHIVDHRKLHGRCNTCGKNFQSMLSYKTQREIIAQNCSWCKLAYHTKDCVPKNLILKYCDLGTHKNIILPPSWVVKLPPRKVSILILLFDFPFDFIYDIIKQEMFYCH